MAFNPTPWLDDLGRGALALFRQHSKKSLLVGGGLAGAGGGAAFYNYRYGALSKRSSARNGLQGRSSGSSQDGLGTAQQVTAGRYGGM